MEKEKGDHAMWEFSGKQLSFKTQVNAAGERRCACLYVLTQGGDLMTNQQWIQGSDMKVAAKPTAHLWGPCPSHPTPLIVASAQGTVPCEFVLHLSAFPHYPTLPVAH